MSDLEVISGQVVSEDDYLEALASRVRAETRNLKAAYSDAVESFFVIGQCLNEARQALASNEAYGAWFAAQAFGFTTQWGRVLRAGASNEVLVRPALQSQLSNGSTSVNFEQAVRSVTTSTTRTPRDAPRRSALTDAATQAGWELRKSVERVQRVCDDDRFKANKEQVASQLRSHLLNAIEVCQDLLTRIEP